MPNGLLEICNDLKKKSVGVKANKMTIPALWINF